ncbi:MAG: Transcriptional regulator, AraC family protein [Moraxellaceae bacterium]|nr:Transcriptional regulator, AraC family protein [Moraxellaceae bacterium]
MSDVLTPASLVLLTLQMLMDDLDIDDLLDHAGVSEQILLAPDGALSPRDILALTASSRELTGDPALGLHLGEEMGVEMLDVVGMALSTAPTLRDAFRVLQRYSPLLTTMGQSELIEDGDSATIVLRLLDEIVPITDFCVEMVAAAVWHIGRRLVKGELRLRRLTISAPRPSWHEEYARVLGEEVVYQTLLEQAARRLAALPAPETTRASVLRLIDEHMGTRLLDLSTIAIMMGMTPRTLQRRLKDENTTFQFIHDNRRQQLAQDMLRLDTDIETIAATLGYSEPANFYRAFKAWTGLSPNEFRRHHRR